MANQKAPNCARAIEHGRPPRHPLVPSTVRPGVEALRKLAVGTPKLEVYRLIGHPMYREGIAGVHEWDYVFKLPDATSGQEVTCQFKMLFDDQMLARESFWNPAGCADLIGPVDAAKAPVEPHVAATAELSADFLFDFDDARLSNEGPAAITAKLSEMLAHVQNVDSLQVIGYAAVTNIDGRVTQNDDAGKTGITLGGEGATAAVTVRNVADGVDGLDAVNVSQLNQRLQRNTTEVLVQANAYTDQRINDVWTGMSQLSREVVKQDRRISQHGAMSMAAVQMASGAAAAAVDNPNGAWSVGLGFEQGYAAISAGYAKPVGEKSHVSFGAAFGGDERSLGVGFARKL